MFPDHIYANLTRDELWHFVETPRLRESRLDGGHALTVSRGEGIEILASDDFNKRFSEAFTAPWEIEKRLRESCGDDHRRLRDLLAKSLHRTGATARVVSTIRFVENAERSDLAQSCTATVHHGGISLTVDLRFANGDWRLSLLQNRKSQIVNRKSNVPLVWRGGSGAVLLHEAIGHPAERSIFRQWPQWLSVTDEPSHAVDDIGQSVATRRLTRGEPPAAWRRQYFGSVPTRRLTNVVVGATPEGRLPDPRLEIWLVESGHYDPLLDTVQIEVSRAFLVSGRNTRPVRPFTFRVRRNNIQIRGAAGSPTRYPGVICFDEGQHLPVGSVAPDLITA